MWAHYANELHWIPFAVLGASFLGSGHCIAMCGGLVTVAAQKPISILRYHFGRLVGYCALGALAGFLGETLLRSSAYFTFSIFMTVFLAAGFIAIGVQIWKGRPHHFITLPQAFWRRMAAFGPGISGLMSAFLPCGWLHIFVLGAVATQSSHKGAMYLFVFWLGTLPALTLGPWGIRKILQPLSVRTPKLSAAALILIGIVTLAHKTWPSFSELLSGSVQQTSGHCH